MPQWAEMLLIHVVKIWRDNSIKILEIASTWDSGLSDGSMVVMITSLTENWCSSVYMMTPYFYSSCRYLAAGSSNAVKLSKFFDKVIEKKLSSNSVTSPTIQPRELYFHSQNDSKKRTYSPSRLYSNPNKGSYQD